MDSYIEKLRVKCPWIEKLYESKIYPPAIALLVALGHITATEFYCNILLLLSVSFGLLVCKRTLFMITPTVAFIYQIPLSHSPGFPTFSEYYFEGARLYILLALAALTLFCLQRRFVENMRGRLDKKTPLSLPLIILSATLLLNGAFSAEWSVYSTVMGLVQVVSFFPVFYLFYFGLEGISAEELINYFCYATLCISFVLAAEMANMFITYEGIISDGAIVKDKVNLGWGIWNPVGFSLTVLLPMLLFGAMRMSCPALYLSAAFLTYGGALLTMSRNALIFATLAFAVCLAIGSLFGKRKKLFRITTIVCIFAVITLLIVFGDKIAELFSRLFEQGISDNGRFDLWKIGIDNFLSSPIFGTGFFGYGETDVFEAASFIPTMAHNTVVQLLSATGILGLLAYGFYRVKTLIPLFRKPTLEKSMLYLPLLLLLGMSLLDNFVFYLYTVFYANAALAIIFRIEDGE